MSQKRTLDAYFASSSKRPRHRDVNPQVQDPPSQSHHRVYPFPISDLPTDLSNQLQGLPASEGKAIKNKRDLEVIYFEPFVPTHLARPLFEFWRSALPFYRVEYRIKRGGVESQVRTPRWTTVFGLDETSRFGDDGFATHRDTGAKVTDRQYERYPPRPVPKCLDELRKSVERATNCQFNFCLVNYYASGADSISFHSDDEGFLGSYPAIASLSFGARRDFLMKHKTNLPSQQESTLPASSGEMHLKLPLGSGDMILMQGKTQSNWLHSIPKRSGKNQGDGGRINITFRRAMVKGGTENYYNYNVGNGPVYRWNKAAGMMTPWDGQLQSTQSKPTSPKPI